MGGIVWVGGTAVTVGSALVIVIAPQTAPITVPLGGAAATFATLGYGTMVSGENQYHKRNLRDLDGYDSGDE